MLRSIPEAARAVVPPVSREDGAGPAAVLAISRQDETRMTGWGLTKARSMGRVAEVVERAGGSPAKVFRAAELPLRLVDHPERLILLRDQLRLIACAAREIGDPALGARLSVEAGILGLGALADHVLGADRLDVAIARANSMMGTLLQSSTRIELWAEDGIAHWTYGVTDRSDEGRQFNECLALGYMLDLLRRFIGPRFTPLRAAVAGPPLPGRTAVEDVLRTDLGRSARALVSFPEAHLLAENPAPRPQRVEPTGREAIPDDLVGLVEHLILLELLAGRPALAPVARRLGMSARTLQRRLVLRGITFEQVARSVLRAEAESLLRQRRVSIAAVALDLGYSEPAHFTRAFRGWTGLSPRAWQRRSA
ncbi:AraC family transcriptional regulator [Xanthobacter aminoxidans]|uniref:AraC family transcriptional regulator n=1 Tax=Xanthobacter aminoxidans TaxID=186280 RepID=UPI002022B814|nr:AraC family transcriptional regulator [Xanthobacter aminoxidans]MCL8383117.1 AraC family transcriptional regulator [Xanthobacter aminoxidans]